MSILCTDCDSSSDSVPVWERRQRSERVSLTQGSVCTYGGRGRVSKVVVGLQLEALVQHSQIYL